MLHNAEAATPEAAPALIVRDLNTGRSEAEIEAIYSQYGSFTKS